MGQIWGETLIKPIESIVFNPSTAFQYLNEQELTK
nr:MAG TPA: hypothetical protein [Caudoviricetes sp.]